jgi:2,3-bisphosphoglycerate-independent phosphoglycerate mutase
VLIRVCEALVEAVKSDIYDVIIVNFANPDMVGHTGIESAVIKAVETVDECVGKAVDAVKEQDGIIFILADHGNAEQLIDPVVVDILTAHTINPVPFMLVNAGENLSLKPGGCLADVVPTLLELMGMEKPAEMSGESLLIK